MPLSPPPPHPHPTEKSISPHIAPIRSGNCFAFLVDNLLWFRTQKLPKMPKTFALSAENRGQHNLRHGESQP